MKYGWNKNRDVWNDIPEYLVNAKWTDLHFQKESLNIIPNKTGIYIMYLNSFYNIKENLKFCTPIYVGIGNLKRRFKDHIDETKEKSLISKFKKNLKYKQDKKTIIYYAYMLLNNRDQMRTIEQYFIDTFGPMFNNINSKKISVKKVNKLRQ